MLVLVCAAICGCKFNVTSAEEDFLALVWMCFSFDFLCRLANKN